jgi:hypothetical protein
MKKILQILTKALGFEFLEPFSGIESKPLLKFFAFFNRGTSLQFEK